MRLFANLVIATGLLLVFNAFGWLRLNYHGNHVQFDHLTTLTIGSVALVAVVIWIAEIILDVLYSVAACLTLGLIMLAYPLLGWLALKLAAHYMPDRLELHGFWITALCGFLLMVVKLHRPRTDNDD